MEDSSGFTCSQCSHWTVAPPGAGYKHDTKRVGLCSAPRPEWTPKDSKLIEHDDPMAEVCECFRLRRFGS